MSAPGKRVVTHLAREHWERVYVAVVACVGCGTGDATRHADEAIAAWHHRFASDIERDIEADQKDNPLR